MEAWKHGDFVWSFFFLGGGWNDKSEYSSKRYIYIYIPNGRKWFQFSQFLKFFEWLNAFSAFGPINIHTPSFSYISYSSNTSLQRTIAADAWGDAGTIITQRKAGAKPQIFGTFRGASATWEESAPGGRSQLPWIPEGVLLSRWPEGYWDSTGFFDHSISVWGNLVLPFFFQASKAQNLRLNSDWTWLDSCMIIHPSEILWYLFEVCQILCSIYSEMVLWNCVYICMLYISTY